MKSDRAAIRGYYRFIEKANERGTTPADILAPHRRRTIERMRTEKTVLCLQDGTDINYSTRPACEGLEVIGRNQTTAKARGVHLHTTLALSAEGLPLGVLRCAYRTQAGKHAAKTQQWIDGLHDLAEAATHLSSKTRVLCVMDREADIFALFAAQQQVGRVDLLVRAKANRRLGRKGPLLFEFMRQGAPKGTIEVAIQRLSRREKSGRVKHKGRAGRIAQMEVRYRTVMLPPTRGQQGGPVKVTAIHVGEADPPEGQKAIQWYLLTTREVTSVAQAVTMVDYYMLRWRVEDGFRILKSVCKVQELRLQKADSLHLAITINMVMAWRLHLMTLLGRQDPEAPAEILFTDIELCVLREYAEGFNLASPDDLAAAILLLAMMGGYMNRKSDPPPGAKIMSRGYLRLEACAVTVLPCSRRSTDCGRRRVFRHRGEKAHQYCSPGRAIDKDHGFVTMPQKHWQDRCVPVKHARARYSYCHCCACQSKPLHPQINALGRALWPCWLHYLHGPTTARKAGFRAIGRESTLSSRKCCRGVGLRSLTSTVVHCTLHSR